MAIIALLSALLLPVFDSARDKARQSACASNLKQLGLGLLQYLQDYDERYPVGQEHSSGGGVWGGQGWAGELMAYVKNTRIFTCPSDSFEPPDPRDTAISYVYNDALMRSDTYANVCTVAGYSNASPPILGIGTVASRLTAPANTVFLSEMSGLPADLTSGPENGSYSTISTWDLTSSASTATSGLYSPATECTSIVAKFTSASHTIDAGSFQSGFLGGIGPYETANDPSWTHPAISPSLGRHRDGSNFLLADGHVKWFRGSEVSPGNMAPSPGAVQDNCRAEGTLNGTHAVTFSPY